MWRTIKDWFWWKFVIKENEFHYKLRMDVESVVNKKISFNDEMKRVRKLRARAHRLDKKWGNK